MALHSSPQRWLLLLCFVVLVVNAALPSSPGNNNNNNVTCSSVRSAYRARGLPDRDVPQSQLPISGENEKNQNKSLVSIHVSKQEKCVAAALSLMRWKTFVIVIDSTSYVPLLFSSIFNWRWSLPVYGAPSIIKTSRSSHYLSTVIKWNRADPQKPSTNQTIGRETGSVGNQVPFLFFSKDTRKKGLYLAPLFAVGGVATVWLDLRYFLPVFLSSLRAGYLI